jgi:glycosyltransferase involved in cell wall biosynthesis
MPYLVEHERTGLLSPVGDPGALASNVDRLLRDPELSSRLARNAHEQSREYEWGIVREEWVRVYRRLLGSVPGTRESRENLKAVAR